MVTQYDTFGRPISQSGASIVPSSNLAARYAPAPVVTPAPTVVGTTLAQDQAKAANQGKPGYDILGNPIATAPAPANAAPAPMKSPMDAASEAYYAAIPKGVDEAAIRESVRQRMQAQIDSTNAFYANLTTAQQQENQGQYGRVRALNTASGLQGSDFGSGNAARAEEKGNAALVALEREKQAKIAEVLGNIDSRAVQEITDARNQARLDLKDQVDYLQGRQTQARGDIATLAKSGVTLEQMSPEQYKKLLDQSGYDEFTLKTVYNNARSAREKIDYQWKTIGNKIIGYGVDPLTGQISTVEKDLPGDVPQNYKPQVLDNGTIVFYPDQMDPTKPVKDQIVTYDTGVRKDTRTQSEKDNASTAGRVKSAAPAVAALRDPQSGYVDPQAYSDMYQTYIETNPGKGKEFIDNFPPSIYIDPAERYKFTTSGS